MSDLLRNALRINAVCLDAAMGRGPYVYAEVDGDKRRIVAARTRKGTLEVKILAG